MTTDVQKNQDIYERVISFVKAETRTRKELTLSTDILRDLGVDGDDARELMARFGSEFSVDMSSFNSIDYFGAEGFGLLQFLGSVIGRRGKSPIMLGHLVRVAESRTWTNEDQISFDDRRA